LQLTGNGIPVQAVKVTCLNEFDTCTATTIPVEYNRQNKCVVVVLAWYTTLVLKFVICIKLLFLVLQSLDSVIETSLGRLSTE
jgi:hypothetical protein